MLDTLGLRRKAPG